MPTMKLRLVPSLSGMMEKIAYSALLMPSSSVSLGGKALNLREGEGGQPHCSYHQNAFWLFARRLFENFVLPHGDVLRLFFLQGFKEQVKGCM